jgi:site-specific recombinase XerD
VRSLRSSWKDGAIAKKKKQERLTGFYWFCIRADCITTTPTHNLGRIAVNQVPTDYFAREEFDKLRDATYLYRESHSEESIGGTNGARLRTLLLLMHWSGVRIRDAITLERTRLVGDNLRPTLIRSLRLPSCRFIATLSQPQD